MASYLIDNFLKSQCIFKNILQKYQKKISKILFRATCRFVKIKLNISAQNDTSFDIVAKNFFKKIASFLSRQNQHVVFT